jgi:hypothetical protein
MYIVYPVPDLYIFFINEVFDLRLTYALDSITAYSDLKMFWKKTHFQSGEMEWRFPHFLVYQQREKLTFLGMIVYQ